MIHDHAPEMGGPVLKHIASTQMHVHIYRHDTHAADRAPYNGRPSIKAHCKHTDACT